MPRRAGTGRQQFPGWAPFLVGLTHQQVVHLIRTLMMADLTPYPLSPGAAQPRRGPSQYGCLLQPLLTFTPSLQAHLDDRSAEFRSTNLGLLDGCQPIHLPVHGTGGPRH